MAQSPPSEFVTLVSDDGFEFIIPREAACVSGTIRRMLDPSSEYNIEHPLLRTAIFTNFNHHLKASSQKLSQDVVFWKI